MAFADSCLIFLGFGMKVALSSFHFLGMYHRAKFALITHSFGNISGPPCSISGWVLYVPEDLYGLNELRAHLIFSVSTTFFALWQFSLEVLLGGSSSNFSHCQICGRCSGKVPSEKFSYDHFPMVSVYPPVLVLRLFIHIF